MIKRFGNLDRKENTKDINKENILPDKKAQDLINSFNNIVDDIESKFKLITELENKNLTEIKNNILRSQIVFLMSGLDYYMHELIKYGIVSIFKGDRKKTRNYNNFSIALSSVEKAIKNKECLDWLEEGISYSNKINTFMAWNKIKQALLLISDNKNFLSNVAKSMNTTEKNLKNNINNIYERRNQITHQSDRDPVTGKKSAIDRKYVEDSIKIIKLTVNTIHSEIIKDI